MLNSNHKNTPCDFTEQMISYFYDEVAEPEKVAFETHLKNCSSCADDFQGFEFARSSVIEWRDEEFCKLESPVFEFPTIKTVSQSVESNSRSWLSDFRKMFSFNPLTATAVLAALIVCVGIVFLAINSSKNSELAEIDNKNGGNIIASPTVTEINKEPKKAIALSNFEESSADKSLKSSDTEAKVSQPSPIREKRIVASDSVAKVSNNMKNNSEKSPIVRNVKETNREIKKTPAAQKQQVPNLTTLDDEEDESLRLADLFDEIDAK